MSTRYAVLPVGSDRNTPNLTDAQLTQLATQAGPVNQQPYVSSRLRMAYLTRQQHTHMGGTR